MSISQIDYYANTTSSTFGRSATWVKIAIITVIIAGVVIKNDPTFLLVWYVMTLAVLAGTDLPFGKIIKMSLYPLVFALVFALTFYFGAWTSGVIIILKVVTASTAVLVLVCTTKYPALFNMLGYIITPTLASMMALTYRSIFILLDVFDSTMESTRLRGGFKKRFSRRSLQNLATVFGLTIMKGIDASEEIYETMRLRGFNGIIRYTDKTRGSLVTNIQVGAIGIVFIFILIIGS